MAREVLNRRRMCRRDFLEVGAAGLLGMSIADLLAAGSSAAGKGLRPARNCIFVWLAGGPATIDIWDMKPDAANQIRGEFRPIATTAHGLGICEHLPELARVMNRCVLVRSVSHTLADHSPGTELVTTGHAPTPALAYPCVGSLATKLVKPHGGVPPYIVLGENAPAQSGFLSTSASPLRIVPADLSDRRVAAPVGLPDGFSVDDLGRRNVLRERLDRQFAAWDQTQVATELSVFESRAMDILRADKTRKALDLRSEPQAIRDRYGNGWPGQALLAARRLVEAGVGFVTASISGWDTHTDNFGRLRSELLPQLDRALASLIGDLDQRGLLDDTLVYCAGEFGRTPNVNGAAGRDHWPRAMSVLLAGGSLRRGFVHGSTDKDGYEPESGTCSPADINATLLALLGVAPQTTLRTPAGRPINVFGDGKSIGGIVRT
ncbi:MAG TPA: DUF1501 domain-containing protein [Planctomycetaceae bacterium]|nr:DUF1501 domain-containing protein [Planctomycetaceae bacterium]